MSPGSGCDFQVGKMGDRSFSHLERNTAIQQWLFEIVDNQRRLLGPVDVKLGNLSFHLNPEFCPLSGDKVDIRLVFTGSLPAELIPRESWNRDESRYFFSRIDGVKVSPTSSPSESRKRLTV
jgi:hypothetical protein